MNGLYEVSNMGNVRSLDRIIKDTTKDRTQKIKGRLLKPCDNGKGYKVVFLNKNRKRKNFYIHRLVSTHFIENPNNYKEINHKNLNKSDNSIFNLEWITQIENKRHYRNSEKFEIAHKKMGQKAKKTYREKIAYKIPIVINMYKNQNKPMIQISKETGLGQSYIKRILVENNIELKENGHLLEFNGEKHNYTNWSKKLNIPVETIKDRCERGLPVEEILNAQYVR